MGSRSKESDKERERSADGCRSNASKAPVNKIEAHPRNVIRRAGCSIYHNNKHVQNDVLAPLKKKMLCVKCLFILNL